MILLRGSSSNGLEVRMGHSFFCGQSLLYCCLWSACRLKIVDKHISYLVVISQKLVQKVQRIVADESLVFRIDKMVPVLLRETSQNIIVLGVELNIILVKIIEQLLGPQDLGNLDELIRVGVSMEEWFFPENHGCEHGTE